MTTLVTYKINGVTFKATKEMNVDFDDLVMWVVQSRPNISEIVSRLQDMRGKHPGDKTTLKSLLVSYVISRNK